MKKSLLYIALFAALLSGIPAYAQEVPVTKSYLVRYKTVEEFLPLVMAMLSNRGESTGSPEMNMIVVVDRPANIAQIDSLFKYFDRPKQQFLINIQLLLASNDPEAVQAPDSTALHQLLDTMFTYMKYEELDKVFIRAEEKSATVFDLAKGQFSIAIDVDYIPGALAPVRFRSFVLYEYVRDISGKFLKTIYASSSDLRENIREVLAAVKLESAGKTLILLVSVNTI